MTIDINKKYRTLSGQEVRIYSVDGRMPYIVHGAIEWEHGWSVACWDDDGNYYGATPNLKLVEAKLRIKQKVWVNVYPDHCLGAYHEKRHADEMAAPHRIGCVQVEIECEEGEGL